MTDKTTSSLDDISLLDPATQSEPYDAYARIQAEPGVYRMPETGFYVVTRYDDLRQVLTDPKTFSNNVDRASLQGEENSKVLHDYLDEHGWPHIQTLQRTDAPVHSRYRKLVDRVFTVGRVRDLSPHIEATANKLIDGFAERGECEFMAEYALLLPGVILAQQMGLDADEVGTFRKWGEAMLAPASRVMDADALCANADIELEAQHHLARLFEERRANPRDDLVSALVHAHGDTEDPLSMAELQSVMSQLIGGGFDTTTAALGHAMMQLVTEPELQDRLREDPSHIRRFVEEVIRFKTPTQALRRRTTRDVELSGTLIPAGSVVSVRYGAANRDEAKFGCPHQFDMERANVNQHLGFGAGAHFCVGAPLARAELAIGILTMLNRLDDIRLARPLDEPIHVPSFLTYSLRELPIAFTAKAAD
ncbi:cytochrome P450 [Croceicoccus ponticola]|uniref:Cytochrome P450 n=1 Tax=Croceicoccus ponticola TaxID=2217664 RepID=A0A437GZ93_9SPHN|nr:cytochrome P450 [Croceicoccus ponticola]RVQ68676.1 cytochrome P450 [Croceicoccus ponticola]